MAFTQADIDALKAQIVSTGYVRNITFSDQSVTFNSIEDMIALLALMEREALASSRRSFRFAVVGKGV